MLTLRGWTSERDGRIHTDSTAKRVTVLLYLNEETEAFGRQEGCLRLLRGPDDLEDYAVEVPPVNGRLLIFPNGASAWHGHRRFVGQRYSIQLELHDHGPEGAQRVAPAPDFRVRQAPDDGGVANGFAASLRACNQAVGSPVL